jgi:hypothetical protein
VEKSRKFSPQEIAARRIATAHPSFRNFQESATFGEQKERVGGISFGDEVCKYPCLLAEAWLHLAYIVRYSW